MNAKPFLFMLWVAWATGPLTALGQSSTASRTTASPPAQPGASAQKPAAQIAAKPATVATPASATRLASARQFPGEPIASPPSYYPGPGMPYDYDPVYSEDGCCGDDSCCGAPGFLEPWVKVPCLSHWGSVEYLLWWRKGEFLPVLVSNGPFNAANPNTTALFGGGTFDFGPQPGGRITLGTWLDDQECWGVGGRFFALGEGNLGFQQNAVGGLAAGQPGALFRPFIEADTGNPVATNVGGAFGGSINVATNSEVYGGDVLLRKRIECACEGRLDFIFGYQFSRFNESVGIQTSTNTAAAPAPNPLVIFDQFDARNEFHGGMLGLQADLDRGPVNIGMLAKVGLGNMNETVNIAGGGNPANTGLLGLLAQTTNVGAHSQDSFAVVPEFNCNLNYRMTENFDLTFGYSMIYWSHVLRPGGHIDTTVDTTPGVAPIVARPAFNFNATDFFVMGLNVGCQWSF